MAEERQCWSHTVNDVRDSNILGDIYVLEKARDGCSNNREGHIPMSNNSDERNNANVSYTLGRLTENY